MNRQVTPLAADSLWRQRARNALLLSACADAVAVPLTGRHVPEPALVDAALNAAPSEPLQCSHATAQTLVIAEHLAAHNGKLDEDDLAQELAQEWSQNRAGSQATGAQEVLADIIGGAPWWESAPALFSRQGSYGNGAAIRTSPIGLLPAQAIGTIAQIARRSSCVTHTHPLARDGAAVVAVAVALAAHGYPAPGIDTDRFLAAIAGHVRTAEFRAALNIVRTLVRHRAGPVEVAATVGSETTALRSVPAALTAFLRYPDDPVAAIRFTLLMGGQTQAVAAMTGAMAGARCPQFTVPSSWRPTLDHTLRLRSAAAALANLDDQPSS